MLDIGTRPDDYALLKLYAAMQADDQCGGCCGEIEVDLKEVQESACQCKADNPAKTKGPLTIIGKYLV